MTKLTFITGQRWVSSTEPEAGLGIVVDCIHRRVEISFPAIGEHRIYAIDNAPLNRVQYSEGDSIRCDEGRQLVVRDVYEKEGRFVYLCLDDKGRECQVDELNLDSFVQFSKPQDRLFSGQIDSRSRFKLRRETLEHQRRLQQSGALGLLGARAQLLPHQFYIASEVASRHAPRVLLADEVGLGKTIEAGLIIHQQLVSGRAGRVLIVVPDSLIHQWLVEMLRRFNLMFTILDEARCQGLEGSGDSGDDDRVGGIGGAETAANPFESAQLVICSLSFLVNEGNRQQQACEAGWDLMVVDEAHHLGWSPEQASPQYLCIEALAARVPGLLLLTATPEQLGVASHFARLRLLDPDRYHSLDQFCDEEADYRQVSLLVEKLLKTDAAHQLRLSTDLLDQLDRYLGKGACSELIAALGDNNDHSITTTIGDIVRSLLDRHGTGRVLFRNTRDAVAGFPERNYNPHLLPTPDSYAGLCVDATIEQRLRPETLFGDSWLATDSRVQWLVRWLADLRDDEGKPEKALVICARADTAQQLENHLNLRAGVRSAVFHEGMTLVARDRAAAYFADDEDSAQVLVCSEIGSEGRNFQFARHLVLFDLPLNPDLLEQRIGRLDRIGQRHRVQIHVPHYDSGAQRALANWYHLGLNAFERVCPVGFAIYEQVEERLLHCLGSGADEDALVSDTRELTAAALQKLQEGRDRLLELSSCNVERAEQVLAEITAAECPQVLADYMETVFDKFGIDHSYHSLHALVIRPGDHMHCEAFPGLLEDGMTLTFNRTRALSREDMHFLSWEHPMVTGVMDMIVGGDFGNVAICTLKLPPLKPGTLLLESFFTLHCPAPKSLQLYRFLPMSRIRVVVDVNGKDLSAILATEHFDRLGQKIAKPTAEAIVRHARPQITAMIKRAEELALAKNHNAEQGDLIANAIVAMEKRLGYEHQRLVALSRINPNIRQDEIDAINNTMSALKTAMQRAEWRMDSLRVAITT